MFDYTTYLSPFTWRYGTQEMRAVWSEQNKRLLWRHVWACLAQVQSELGLIPEKALNDIKTHATTVDINRSLEVEAEIHHDLMAELRVFADQCKIGGGALHLGATSMDIEDNAEIIRIRQASEIIEKRLQDLLALFAEKIDAWDDLMIIGYTHLQPAEPTTLGYRLACYAQDLLVDTMAFHQLSANLKGKGFRGAVGTSASYLELIELDDLPVFESRLSELIGFSFFDVTAQTYPRLQDYRLLNILAAIAATLYKFAFDLRFMQSPQIGEWSEPFSARQVGSSAMPFKRNPVNAEKIDSLARLVAQMPAMAWHNAAHSLLERTLDDNANRRMLLPEAYLIMDEILLVTYRILKGLRLDQKAIQRNLQSFAPFAAIERVLMELSARGANRQAVHHRLRDHSMTAWEALRAGSTNPLPNLVASDEDFLRFLSQDEILALMNIDRYTGDAPQRARLIAQKIREFYGG